MVDAGAGARVMPGARAQDGDGTGLPKGRLEGGAHLDGDFFNVIDP
jgi:hypothetical protein